MIDYKLYCHMEHWIRTQYATKVYLEDAPLVSNNNNSFLNIGVLISNNRDSKIIVMCEYDEGEPNSGVYVGIKCIGCDCQIDTSLIEQKYGSSISSKGQVGENNRFFKWAYWKSIQTINEGKDIFADLLQVNI